MDVYQGTFAVLELINNSCYVRRHAEICDAWKMISDLSVDESGAGKYLFDRAFSNANSN